MKNFKNILRIMLAVASALSFLGGWITLAHSRKPVQPTQAQPHQVQELAPLAPLPPINGGSNNNNNGLFNLITPGNLPASRSRVAPMFRTSGS